MNAVNPFDNIEHECAEFVSGYVANRYFEKYSQLTSIEDAHKTCWTNFLSRRALKIPSKSLMESVHLLEICFIQLHGEKLSKIPSVMKYLINIFKQKLTENQLNIPEEVLSCMV